MCIILIFWISKNTNPDVRPNWGMLLGDDVGGGGGGAGRNALSPLDNPFVSEESRGQKFWLLRTFRSFIRASFESIWPRSLRTFLPDIQNPYNDKALSLKNSKALQGAISPDLQLINKNTIFSFTEKSERNTCLKEKKYMYKYCRSAKTP